MIARMSENILQFFKHEHLPLSLSSVCKPFCELAENIVDTLPRNQERTVALRKLLEAKDAAVRALLSNDGWEPIFTPNGIAGYSPEPVDRSNDK